MYKIWIHDFFYEQPMSLQDYDELCITNTSLIQPYPYPILRYFLCITAGLSLKITYHHIVVSLSLYRWHIDDQYGNNTHFSYIILHLFSNRCRFRMHAVKLQKLLSLIHTKLLGFDTCTWYEWICHEKSSYDYMFNKKFHLEMIIKSNVKTCVLETVLMS